MISDLQRLDLHSASSAYADRRCPGRQNLIRALRERGDLKEIPQSEEATSGTRIHRAWAGESLELSAFEAKTLEELKRLEALVVADWAGQSPYYLIGREERLYLREGIEPLSSGQYDAAYGAAGGRILILDAKTLYGEVQPAEHNDQLRELVALFLVNYPQSTSFRVAILSPNLSERTTVADYDRHEAELALRLTRLGLADSADPDAPRTPGAWCNHCPAMLQCEEARALVGRAYSLARRIEEGEFSLPLGERGSRVLDSVKTAKKILETLESAYKREIEANPLALPGWHLKPGKKVRKITLKERALELAVAQGLSLQDFLSAAEISVTRLSLDLGKASGLSGRALSNRFTEVFGPCITFEQRAPELERVASLKPPKSSLR